MRQYGFIREAECAVNGIRLRTHFKPLQQGNILRVIGKVKISFLYGDGYCRIRQHLNGITLFQIALAYLGVCRLAGELPPRGRVFNEWVCEGLGDLMRKSGYILEAGSE